MTDEAPSVPVCLQDQNGMSQLGAEAERSVQSTLLGAKNSCRQRGMMGRLGSCDFGPRTALHGWAGYALDKSTLEGVTVVPFPLKSVDL